MQGRLLLHRTTFNTGAHQPTSTLLLPRTPTTSASSSSPAVPPPPSTNGHHHHPSGPPATTPPPHALLLAAPTGQLAALTALPEPSHRRLTLLSNALAAQLTHAAALNPRAYRAGPAAGPAVGAGPQLLLLPGIDPLTGGMMAGGGGGGGAGGGGGGWGGGGGGGAYGRNVVDGALLDRWNELGTARRSEVAGRAGYADGVAGGLVAAAVVADVGAAGGGGAGAGAGAGAGDGDAGWANTSVAVLAAREELRREARGWNALAYF